MKLRSVSFRGLTRFTGEQPVTISFNEMGAGLVALVGENGAGKTTAMESVPAGLFKSFPSRPGSLYEAAHGRDAFIELTFDDGGQDVAVRLLIDAERRTTEGYVLVDGSPVTDGKAAAFESAIAERFGSRELFLASVFAAQNKAGNFLEKRKGDRKALFVELLGLSHLEGLASEAHAKTGQIAAALAGRRDVAAELERECSVIPEVRAALDNAQAAVSAATSGLETTRQREQKAIKTREDARAARGKLEALQAADRAAATTMAQAARNLHEAMALAPAARKRANERRNEIDARGADRLGDEAHRRHSQGIEGLLQRKRRAESELERKDEVRVAKDRLREAKEAQAQLASQLAEAARLSRESDLAERALEVAESALEKAEAVRERELAELRRRAALLGDVPCTEDERWFKVTPIEDYLCQRGSVTLIDPQDLSPETVGRAVGLSGACPLLADARQARERLAAMEQQQGCEEERQAVKEAAQAWKLAQEARAGHPGEAEVLERKQKLEAEIERLSTIVLSASAVERAERELIEIAEEKRRLDQQLQEDLERAKTAAEKAQADRAAAESQLQEELRQAEQRVTEAQVAFDNADEERAKAQIALEKANESLADGGLGAAEQAVVEEQKAVRDVEKQLQEAQQGRARAQQRLEDLQAKNNRLQVLRGEMAGVEQELGDWALLADALGKDGIQALEVDAAGPEVARLTNELLESCYGPRFSISFETLREKKSKRGEFSEVFDIQVFDAGQQRPVEALSGGEKVIVGEAINLALAVFNARKSGVRWETLFRDETAGALDPENASKYVSMLRRAMQLGGFEQVIFVAHLPEVWERADAKVRFADGNVRVAA